MLWPLILPTQITLGVLALVLVVATYVAPRLGQSRNRVLAWGVPLAFIAFVPSCSILMAIMDQHRFGVFEHENFEAMNDDRVQRSLPDSATDITIEKSARGYRAKFSISRESLEEWYDESWNRDGEFSDVPRSEEQASTPVRADAFEFQYGDLGWPPLEDAVEYVGPTAPNGAGFMIWYSESEGIAYQHVGYW